MSSKKEIDEATVAVSQMIIVIPWALSIILLNSWALKTLWFWFVVPLTGLPALSLPVAFGLNLIRSRYKKPDDKGTGFDWAGPLFHPLFAVALGYIAHVWWV